MSKDCKHKSIITFSTDHDGGIGYGCDNKGCGKSFEEKEVVILTKAYKKLMQDVIEGISNMNEEECVWIWDDVLSLSHCVFCGNGSVYSTEGIHREDCTYVKATDLDALGGE